jgi:hypothetical protein
MQDFIIFFAVIVDSESGEELEKLADQTQNLYFENWLIKTLCETQFTIIQFLFGKEEDEKRPSVCVD